jgi:YggT family protein
MGVLAGGPVHFTIQVFIAFLVLSIFAQAILSWLPLRPDNPLIRFFNVVTAPVLSPVRRLLPPMTVGMLDIGTTIAYFISWWALGMLSLLLLSALPQGW